MRKVGVALLVACGSHAGSKTIGNEVPREPGALVRVPADPTRDCPPGTLAAIAPGWAQFADSGMYEGGDPGLDACLAGHFAPDGIVVFASAPPPSDSKTEEGTPARELIVDADGKPRIEGPPTGGNWMTGPPTLAGLVDLDGDGVDEIIVETPIDPGHTELHVLRIAGKTLADAGSAPLGDDGCGATWDVKDGAVVIHTQAGESLDPEAPCEAADHTYRLVNGAFADVDPPPPDDDN